MPSLTEFDSKALCAIKEVLDLTDGNLSRHLQVLEEAAGLVIIEKDFQGKRPRTRVRSTRRGRKAVNDHLQTMQALINRVNKEKT